MSSDDYLWDRSGEPDPELEGLEELMGALAFESDETLVLEPPSRASEDEARPRPRMLTVALFAAAATVLLLGGWRLLFGAGEAPPLEPESPAVEPVAQPEDRDEPTDATASERSKSDEAEPAEVRSAPEAEPVEVPSAPKAEPAPAENPPPSQPAGDRPGTEEIADALSEVKGEAKACGPRYGALPKSQVPLRLRIDGPSGTVVEATAEGEDANTPLGKCVADAMAKAQFPRFTGEMVLSYKVRMP